jgi:threonine/homoserine/homoserine lactone efflux protein
VEPGTQTLRIAPLFDGLLTGLFLQAAVGPVFFFILQITLESSYANGLCAVAAATLVDCLYICLSLLGLGRLLERRGLKRTFGLLGSLLLAVFGIIILKGGIDGLKASASAGSGFWTPWRSFAGCFVLTISSPLTIAFWSGLFATKALEKGYAGRQLALFGAGAGAATFLFLASAMLALSLVGRGVPPAATRWMNVGVGILLIAYAVKRGIAGLFREKSGAAGA